MGDDNNFGNITQNQPLFQGSPKYENESLDEPTTTLTTDTAASNNKAAESVQPNALSLSSFNSPKALANGTCPHQTFKPEPNPSTNTTKPIGPRLAPRSPPSASAATTTTTTHISSNDPEMEKKKNELVAYMLQKVKPFCDIQGHLRADANFDAFAALMESEENFVQRTLLLTVLLSGANREERGKVYQAVARSRNLLRIIAEWLNNGSKTDNPMLAKILDLLLLIPLTVDQLLELKIGKVVKRLSAAEGVKQEIRDKAASLTEAWIQLARSEEAKRRASVPLRERTEAKSVEVSKDPALRKPRRTSEPKVGDSKEGVVANLSLFSETAAPTNNPPLKTRAAQILERAARGEMAKVTTRPLSADDIHKAKRRQHYLQEAGLQTDKTTPSHKVDSNDSQMDLDEPPFDGSNGIKAELSAEEATSTLSRASTLRESLSLSSSSSSASASSSSSSVSKYLSSSTASLADNADSKGRDKGDGLHNERLDDHLDRSRRSPDYEEVGESSKRPRTAKKRVSFANETELVQVHYFEPLEEDYYRAEDKGAYSNRTLLHHKLHLNDHPRRLDRLEKNEASFAFKQMALVMEPECEWRSPRLLPSQLQMERGGESGEKEVQIQRERTALSAVYFRLEDVPPSPSEQNVDRPLGHQCPAPLNIPLKDVEGRMKPVVRYASTPAAETKHAVNNSNNNDILGSLLSNPNALQDLLKSVPLTGKPSSLSSPSLERPPLSSSSSLPPSSHFRPPFIPGMPMGMPSLPMGFPPMSHQGSRRMPSSSSSSSAQEPSLGPPKGIMHPPPPLPPHIPTQPPIHAMPPMMPPPGMIPGMPPFPFPMSFPPPLPSTAPHQHHHHRPTSSSHHQKTKLCRFYRKGQPNSCRFGSACQFLHSDY